MRTFGRWRGRPVRLALAAAVIVTLAANAVLALSLGLAMVLAGQPATGSLVAQERRSRWWASPSLASPR